MVSKNHQNSEKMKRLTIETQNEFHEKLKLRAKKNHRSLKSEITHILENELKRSDKMQFSELENNERNKKVECSVEEARQLAL